VVELPLALDETEIGTRTDGFFTFCCDIGDCEGSKGENEISGEIGIALMGLSLSLSLSLSLLALDV
jgi:hypothetical protein